ncbi:MAG: class I SAM-dependent methyltransferase [Daejeonella sp.]
MWDERYSDTEFAYGKNPNDFLASLDLYKGNNKKILCLAEGEGRNAVYMAQLGYDVLAIDQSRVGLQKAVKLAEANKMKINIEQADLSVYNIPPDTYSGIISIFGHFSPSVRSHIHRESVGGLKQGGFFILEAYSKEQKSFKTGGPQNIDMLYDLRDLEKDFGTELNFIIKRKVKREVLEGKYHTGMASVIQLFAVKR